MKIFKTYLFHCVILLTLLSPGAMSFASTTEPIDSVEVDQMILKAENFLQEREYDEAIKTAANAYNSAKKLSYLKGEADGSYVLGMAYGEKNEQNEALKYYFTAIKGFEILSHEKSAINVLIDIANLYQKQGAHEQAISYFDKAYKKTQENDGSPTLKISLLESIAFSQKQLEEYGSAINTTNKLLTEYERTGNKEKTIETYKELSYLSELQRQYRSALKYNTKLAGIHEKNNDLAGMSSAYNNIGFIHKRTGDVKTSSDYFNKVTELVNKQPENIDDNSKAVLHINIGVAYTTLKSYAKARENYEIAHKIREKQENQVEIANTLNYLAGNYYVSGNVSQALKSATDAMELAEANDAKEVLMTSYKILNMIYTRDNNTSKAKKYLEKYKELRDELSKEEKARKEEMLKRQLEIEKNEEAIKTLLAEEERKSIESERRENEIKIKEKELALLKRDQELREIEYKNQLLEKERTEQALTLAQQQLEAEKKNRELASLEKEKELQNLELKRKALEDEKQKKAIQLLEADKQLLEADKKFKDEQLKYTYGIFGLFAVILVIIIISFIQKRRSNKILKAQQYEITEKNEELQQNMEELQATQDILEEQKGQLEVQNKKITFSIKYAHRIQSSILPSESLKNRLFPENFVTYMPKDIVSGDFYWMKEKGNKKILSIVDCTGHGVPGALMSMIGHTTLNEIFTQKNIEDPAEALNELHKGIRNKLSQEESQNHDGMDLGICVLEDAGNDKVNLTYAGAKHTLYVMDNGELIEVDGDRKSIGGANTAATRDYSSQTLALNKGATLYLTTDGYIDQNSPDRKRFNKKRFKNLIQEVQHLSVSEQKAYFEKALASHQQNAEQRDDITLVTVKV